MTIRQNKILIFLSSLKITVFCLFYLGFLTFWGTLYQTNFGLFAAQEKYFNSLILWLGSLPSPGAQLVMFILFINLLSGLIVRIRYSWFNFGNVLIHIGILLFLISGFVTLRLTSESSVMLGEGEITNVSSAYHDWEVALWNQKGSQKEVVAFDVDTHSINQTLDFSPFPIKITPITFYPHARAFLSGESSDIKSVSKIKRIESEFPLKEPEKNIAGGIFEIQLSNGTLEKYFLYGSETFPNQITLENQNYFVKLRKARTPLPFNIKLLDFQMKQHPGTAIAKSFKSQIAIEQDQIWRDVEISMNEPLRYKDFTFYQASYLIDDNGDEFTVLATVKNPGMALPYVATFITFLGLISHFLMVLYFHITKEGGKI